MGKRGPAKTPVALRLVTGEHRPSHLNLDEPIAPDEGLVCPDDANDRVREVWTEAVEWLTKMKIARTPDRYTLRAYCEAVDHYERATAISSQSPPVIRNDRGYFVANPAWRAQDRAALTLLRFSQEFGFSPSARSSIEATKAGNDEDNPFAEAATGS